MILEMKVVQTKLNSLEYEQLRRYAKAKGLTITEALRKIIREHVIEEGLNLDSPIFTQGPVVKKKGITDRTSVEHDNILYGDRT